MNSMIARLFVVAGVMTTAPDVLAQQDVIPVRVLAASGIDQVVRVNAVAGERFVVQVVHAQTGAPIPEALLYIHPNYTGCIPLHPTCTPPPATMYGSFAGGSAQASLVTDAQGFATAPAFRAGSATGEYEMMAGVRSDQGNNGPVYEPVSEFRFAKFALLQVGDAATPVPGPRAWALILLAMAIFAAAGLTQTRREKYDANHRLPSG